MKQGVSMLASVLALPRTVFHAPRHMQLDITTSCNLNCRMCYAKKAVEDSQKQKHLPFEDFVKIFDRVKPSSVNLAASGEPFMNPDLGKIIRYAKQNGAQVIISTNFIVPDERRMREIIDAGLDILKISIDGASREVYEKIRGPYFERLCANLETLSRVLDSQKSARLGVRIDYVLLKPNSGDIASIIDFAKANRISHVFFRICDPRGWDRQQREDLLNGSYNDILSSLRAAQTRAKEQGVVTNLPELLGRRELWRFIYEDSSKESDVKRPVCLLPWMQLFTSVNGDMSYCCSIYPSGGQALGNILRGDDWNGERWQQIRSLFKRRQNYRTFEGCRYCIPMSRRYLLELVRMFPGYLRRFLKLERREKQ